MGLVKRGQEIPENVASKMDQQGEVLCTGLPPSVEETSLLLKTSCTSDTELGRPSAGNELKASKDLALVAPEAVCKLRRMELTNSPTIPPRHDT